jgi:hypothetical protein
MKCTAYQRQLPGSSLLILAKDTEFLNHSYDDLKRALTSLKIRTWISFSTKTPFSFLQLDANENVRQKKNQFEPFVLGRLLSDV